VSHHKGSPRLPNHLLDDIHLAQALNYLKVFDLRVGLLLNFGGVRLEFKRLFRKDLNQDGRDV